MGLGTHEGLDLDARNTLTAEEWSTFNGLIGAMMDYPEGHPAFRVFQQVGRPDRIKQQRALARTFTEVPYAFADLQTYLLKEFELGIEYELRYFRHAGATRDEVVDVYAVANLRSPSRGLATTAADPRLMRLLEHWPEENTGYAHPEGWSVDPTALQAGLDFGEEDLLPGELERIVAWYERVCGEVPAWVAFLGRHHPRMLKQVRRRFEDVLRALPVQYVPYLQLSFSALTANAEGIRENVLMARGLGMTLAQVVETVAFIGVWYGGIEALSLVERAAGDVLADWDAPRG